MILGDGEIEAFQGTSSETNSNSTPERTNSVKALRGRRGMNSTSSIAEEAVDQLHANEKLIAGKYYSIDIEIHTFVLVKVVYEKYPHTTATYIRTKILTCFSQINVQS